MPELSNTAKNLALEAIDEAISAGLKFASLHTAYSASGANELAGGSPAYARVALTWNSASGGQKSLAAGTAAHNVPGGSTVAWVGYWDASSAGTFLGMSPAGGGSLKLFTVNAAGVTADALDAPGHGFSNGDQVVLWGLGGAGLPTGLTEGTIYFVVGSATNTLQLSVTSGGSAINVTAVGAGFLQKIVPEVFGSQGTYQVTGATLDATPI
jgi:hypothetical protein